MLPGEHNKILLDLAFDMATWHAYAKLRMHTSHTIESLRSQTKELGTLLRRYANKVCPGYKTKALPGEAAAAYRRKAAKGKKVGKGKKAASGSKQTDTPTTEPNVHEDSGLKQFNLKTYKIHALGDYADHIEQFGPTDCFSTQQVWLSTSPLSSLLTIIHHQGELEHRRVKRYYKCTNKTRFERQIAKQERMERYYRKYINTLREKTGARKSLRSGSSVNTGDDTSPQQHYSVAKKDRDHVDLYNFAGKHAGDPALKVRNVADYLSLNTNNFPGLCCKTQGSSPRTGFQQTV